MSLLPTYALRRERFPFRNAEQPVRNISAGAKIALPIRFVVNTHYHIDHVNGNDVFAGAGATIVAHRNVRAWMRSENLKFWTDPIPPEIRARVQSLTLPDVVYDDQIDLYLGTRTLEVRYYAGHTGSDSVVFVPDARVVFCGDLLWKNHFPNLIDATTESGFALLPPFSPSTARPRSCRVMARSPPRRTFPRSGNIWWICERPSAGPRPMGNPAAR